MSTRALSITYTTAFAVAALVVMQLGSKAEQASVLEPPANTAARPAAGQAVTAIPQPASEEAAANAPLGNRRLLAPDSAWNTPIDHLPVDPQSQALIRYMGADASLHPDFGSVYEGVPWGIPYVVVSGETKRYPVVFEYAEDSDDVMYPIPPNAPIEGVKPGAMPTEDGDRHMIMVDRDNGRFYELYAALFRNGRWYAGSGAVWDLYGDTKRPRGWTSADAAGLPILPGLVRYDEVVEQGKIEHALRFTARRTRRAFTGPATHQAGRDDSPSSPPMGMRVRLKASVDITGFPPYVQPILVALKKYGMFLADNGGPFFLTGAPDPRWRDADIDVLKRIKGQDFEVVQLGTIYEQ